MNRTMTDKSYEPDRGGPTDALDSDEALLTKEWRLPWLASGDTLQSPDFVRENAPPQSNESRAPVAGPEVTMDASDSCRTDVTTLIGGAAAPTPQPGALRPSKVITIPKKPRPDVPCGAAVTVDGQRDSSSYLGTTLPPIGERQDVPSVEREAPRAPDGLLETLRRHRPLVGVATVCCAAASYAISTGIAQSRRPTAAPMPGFLAAAANGVAAAPLPVVASPAARPSTIAMSEGALGSGADSPRHADAGVEAAPPGAPSPPNSVSPSMSPDTPATTLVPASATPKDLDHLGASSPRLSERTTEAHRNPPVGTQNSPPRTVPPVSSAGPVSTRLRPVMVYTYGETGVFAVATAPERMTDVVLEPGEKLVSRPTTGDSARWVVTVVDSLAKGELQQHVFVKPLRPGLLTNLTLNTTRRTYFLELTSRADGTYMAAVRWKYPLDPAEVTRRERMRVEQEREAATQVADVAALRFDYGIQVSAGAPSWKPSLVFDDGKKTFIRFPRPVAGASAPALFVLLRGQSRRATLVNYRVKDDLYVIDRLVDTMELRLPSKVGAGDGALQEVVRIFRKTVAP